MEPARRDDDRPILGYREPHTQPHAPRVSRTAVVGLVVSVLTCPLLTSSAVWLLLPQRFSAIAPPWLLFIGLPSTAFVLNCVALTRIKDSAGRLRGDDLGLFGLTLSTLWLVPVLGFLCLFGGGVRRLGPGD